MSQKFIASPRILFISHNASLTGAPIVLLYLLRWLRENTAVRAEVLLLEEGPLRSQFEAVAPTHSVPGMLGDRWMARRAIRRLKGSFSQQMRQRDVVGKLRHRRYNLVYGNTVVSLPYLQEFKRQTGVRCVCAVHELTFVIGAFLDHGEARKMLAEMDFIIAGSEAVHQNLIRNYAAAPEKLDVIHAFVETNEQVTRPASELRRELGINDGDFIIGAAGTTDVRKGADLFLPTVQALLRRHPDIPLKAVWLGGHEGDWMLRMMKQDVCMLGLEDVVKFAPHTPHAADYINLYDVFLLLSREDPFPLVAISAAAFQKPVIAFERGGGAVEMLRHGAGIVVPYLDIGAVADAVYRLYIDSESRIAIGRLAAKVARERFSPDIIPGKTWQRLQSLL